MSVWLVRAHLQINCFSREVPLAHMHLFPLSLKIIWKERFRALGDSCLSVTVYEDGAGIGKRRGPILWFKCIRRLLE